MYPAIMEGGPLPKDPEHVFFVTGCRPKDLGADYPKDRAEYEALYGPLKRALRKTFEVQLGQGRNFFWTGMAQGVDQIAAEVGLEMAKENIPITVGAALPFIGQAERWSNNASKPFSKGWWAYLVNQIRLQGPVAIISKDGYSPAAMHARNHYMADNSSACIGVWVTSKGDPFDDATKGGTASTLRYARSLNLPITLIKL